MYFANALDAIRSGQFFAEHSNLVHAVYAEASGYIVKVMTQPTGLELEIIKP